MNISSSVELFRSLAQDDLCFAYSGSFSDSISVKIIDIARTNIDTQSKTPGIKNKVSFLMGECYQNIVRHGFSATNLFNLKEKWNVFFLRNIGGNYFITAANRIANSDIPFLQSRLDRVNSLNPEELKDLQKQVLMKGEISNKGGAGLGIIMMARKTGQDLIYSFEELNEETSLFYLHVQFDEEKSAKLKTNQLQVTLEEMTSLHSLLVKESILIMHKGDFSKDTLLPVLNMIESNLGDKFEFSFISSKLYHITVEVLQNISLHGFRRDGTCEGLFTLGIENDKYVVSASNYVDNTNVKILERHLNELKLLTKEQLNTLYKEKLRLVIDKNDEGIGLGLVDIYRVSENINFQIINQGQTSLFSLVIRL